jgi:catechol 2,3-dioxygenase-like lactoylglutathione lyase family enzyme
MLHHVSVGVSDLARAACFYDSVLGALGYKRVMEVLPYGIGYGEATPIFWVQPPHDRNPPSAGNGVHVALVGRSKAVIEMFHRAALEAGGRDEGAPGPRPDYGPHYFGAFVRDLDGNKLEAVLVVVPRAARAAPAVRKKAKKTKAKKTPKVAKRVAKKEKRVAKKATRAGARRKRK